MDSSGFAWWGDRMTTNRNWVKMVTIQVKSVLFITASKTRKGSGDQFSVCIEFLPFGFKRKKHSRYGASQGMRLGGRQWTVSEENSRVVYTTISINFMGSQELGLQGNPPTIYQTNRPNALLNVFMVKIICCGGCEGGAAVSGGHSSHSRAVPTIVGCTTVASCNLKKNVMLNCVPNMTLSSKQKQ